MTYPDLYFRKKERTFWLTCEEQNCTGLRVGGSKKNGSETTAVNQVRDDEIWSAEAMEVHYLGKLRICFGNNAAGEWIWIRCRNKRKDKVKDNFLSFDETSWVDGDSNYTDEEEWWARVNFWGGNPSHPTRHTTLYMVMTPNWFSGFFLFVCYCCFCFCFCLRGVSVSHVCFGMRNEYHSLQMRDRWEVKEGLVGKDFLPVSALCSLGLNKGFLAFLN